MLLSVGVETDPDQWINPRSVDSDSIEGMDFLVTICTDQVTNVNNYSCVPGTDTIFFLFKKWIVT